MAQAVPSSPVVPCQSLTPAGWSLNDVLAGSGSARIVFDIMEPYQQAAITVELTPACDVAGATEVSSEQPGARRYIRIDRGVSPVQVTRTYTFPGGCITERFVAPDQPDRLATEASSAFGFVTREQRPRPQPALGRPPAAGPGLRTKRRRAAGSHILLGAAGPWAAGWRGS